MIIEKGSLFINAHTSFEEFFDKKRVESLVKIHENIKDDYTPDKENIHKYASNDISKIKVCIIGQDPYPSISNSINVASGRAFEPTNLKNWNDSFKQVSIKNIIRLIHKDYNKIKKYDDIYSYSKVKEDINSGKFPILQPKNWFDSIEKQGVLLLNKSLTTMIGKPNSHKELWDEYVKELISYLVSKNNDIIWFLWGKDAQEIKGLLKISKVFESRHPMMCSIKYEDDFLKNKCFFETFNVINWLG